MITTYFYLLIFLAIWHFFYESVLAASMRHGLRYKFFQLRDELRNVKIDNALSRKDEQIYEILDNSICQMIDSMSFISAVNYFRLKNQIHKNNKRRSDIDNLKNFIHSADNINLKQIDKKIGILGSEVLVVNNGGWIIYFIIPLLVLFLFTLFSVQFDKLKLIIIKVSTRLIYSSDLNNESPVELV